MIRVTMMVTMMIVTRMIVTMIMVTLIIVTMMMVTLMMVTLMMRVMRMMRLSLFLQMDDATERLKMPVDSSTLRMGEVGKINKSFANSTNDVQDSMTAAQEKAKL